MKRLDQSHLHPKLEVPELTCPGRESNPASMVGGEHSRKEPLEELVKSYSEHLHISPRQSNSTTVLDPPSNFECRCNQTVIRSPLIQHQQNPAHKNKNSRYCLLDNKRLRYGVYAHCE
jgi:hypothetical protein